MKLNELIVRIVPDTRTCLNNHRISISVVAEGRTITAASKVVPDDDFVSYFDSILLEAKRHLLQALKAEQDKCRCEG